MADIPATIVTIDWNTCITSGPTGKLLNCDEAGQTASIDCSLCLGIGGQ